MPIMLENAFASGVARRPRRKKNLEAGPIVTAKILGPPKHKTRSSVASSRKSSVPEPRLPKITSIDPPLENQAVLEFLRYNSKVNVISDCAWGHLTPFHAFNDSSPSDAVSGLSLALVAASLCFFGKKRGLPRAVSMARENYALALRKVNAALGTPSLAITDEVLVTVTLLGNFEATIGNFDIVSLFSGCFRHMDGAAALMKARQEQEHSVQQDRGIDRILRRLIVRHSIYRGNIVPEWLWDGRNFGETGTELTLDSCLVTTALLRRKSLHLMQKIRQLTPQTMKSCIFRTQELCTAAQALDESLASWAQSLSDEFAYSTTVQTGVDSGNQASCFGGTSATYLSLWHATLWNLYRGARIIANIYIARTLRFLAVGSEDVILKGQLTQIAQAIATQKALVNDVCSAVPYYLEDIKVQVNPREAYTLVWPLVVAAITPGISDDQRGWIYSKISLISDSNANTTLGILAKWPSPATHTLQLTASCIPSAGPTRYERMPFHNDAHSYEAPKSYQEEAHHRSKSTNGYGTAGLSSKLNNIIGNGQDSDLPMYKDKPHFPKSRRRKMSTFQRSLTFFSVIIIILWWLDWLPHIYSKIPERARFGQPTPSIPNEQLWKSRKEAVKDVFVTSWDGYEKYAWGMDEYHPVSKKGRNMVEGGFGWMIVDALDTAIMMNLTSRVTRARGWISTSLTYTADHDVNTFETTIRMLGGLLSAHYLSTAYPHLAPLTDDDVNQPGEDLYIEKATDLADRLLGAYDSPSGIPYASVNLNTSTGIPAGGGSSTSEATTLQLEMKYLSKLTGEPVYWERAEKILKVIDEQHMQDGLLPIFINPGSGTFNGRNIRLGSRGDSYYEYLIKQYLQTSGGEPIYLDLWEEALQGMKKHLITYTKDASLTVLAERQNGLDQPLTAKMDHLVCFMPGTIALAVTNGSTVATAMARLGSLWTAKHDENLKLAEEVMKTCWGMYAVTPTGLAPEISYFHVDDPPRQWQGHINSSWTPPVSKELAAQPDASWRTDYDIHNQDEHNLQRPETVESLFYMWQITRNPMYREWGWAMFESFREHTKLVDHVTGKVYAYSSLNSVMQNPVKDRTRRDNMESFWLAETLKYFYLLFSDDVGVAGGLPGLEEVVINTEAHFFPRFSIEGSKVWKTGWARHKQTLVDVQVEGKPSPPGEKRDEPSPAAEIEMEKRQEAR